MRFGDPRRLAVAGRLDILRSDQPIIAQIIEMIARHFSLPTQPGRERLGLLIHSFTKLDKAATKRSAHPGTARNRLSGAFRKAASRPASPTRSPPRPPICPFRPARLDIG